MVLYLDCDVRGLTVALMDGSIVLVSTFIFPFLASRTVLADPEALITSSGVQQAP